MRKKVRFIVRQVCAIFYCCCLPPGWADSSFILSRSLPEYLLRTAKVAYSFVAGGVTCYALNFQESLRRISAGVEDIFNNSPAK